MLRLFSPAKINLFLRIVSKRSDGYHNLSSVFQTITLGDTLIIEPSAYDRLTCTDPQLPTDESNLILKATALFRRQTNLKHAFNIHLIKRIPTQAGLGGGSSNAATMLWACNQLAKTNLPLHILKQWGATIGSDVPFFFSEGTAYCTGKGESVQPLSALASRSLWIVKPPEALSTPEVYRRLGFDSSAQLSTPSDLEAFLSGSLPLFNDLEVPAFDIYPQLKKLKATLIESGFETVLMSGSGSAFFCIGQGSLPSNLSVTSFPVQFMRRGTYDWYSDGLIE